ncbi:MAG: four helix bundle protein [Rhodothermaceae bacterium]|nr:MAG: four helix bundle protein [Rhodothermaceae bacterium]GIV61568.1 MAG: four helix bundle protein [Rhodothermaceae bacterium]
MATVKRFEELVAWQTARHLVNEIYALTGDGAFARDFGLRDQIQRAAVSVMSNIAEGFESRTQRLFIEHLGRARASCGEVRSQLYVALDLGYIDPPQFDALYECTDKTSRLIYRLMTYLTSLDDTPRVREDILPYDPSGRLSQETA